MGGVVFVYCRVVLSAEGNSQAKPLSTAARVPGNGGAVDILNDLVEAPCFQQPAAETVQDGRRVIGVKTFEVNGQGTLHRCWHLGKGPATEGQQNCLGGSIFLRRQRDDIRSDSQSFVEFEADDQITGSDWPLPAELGEAGESVGIAGVLECLNGIGMLVGG